MTETEHSIRLSPITRLSMSLDLEMNLDKSSAIFNEERYLRYLAMLAEAAKRREALSKSLVLADFLTLMVISGKNVIIPGTDMKLLEFPGAMQSTMLFASLSFMFLCTSFFNEQSYQAIVSQFSIRKGKRTALDPDFISASDTFLEFYLKIYRKKLNIWGDDFFTPKSRFLTFFGMLTLSIILSFTVLVLFHFILIGVAIQAAHSSAGWDPITTACSAFAILANLSGLLVVATMNKDFDFDIEGQPADRQSADAGEIVQ